MPTAGTPFRFYYQAKDSTPSLGDVAFLVIRPDGIVEGAFAMFEVAPGNPLFAGLYYADYTPAQQGHYLVRANSASQPMIDRKGFYAESVGAGASITAQQVRDAMKLAPSSGNPASGSVDEDLVQILAKPTGGGGGVAVVRDSTPPHELAAAVWKYRKRGLTEPVEIAGDMKRLDDLHDVSREDVRAELGALNDLSEVQVRQQVDESNAAQTEELGALLDSVETKESAAAGRGELGGAVFARVDERTQRLEATVEGEATLTRRAIESIPLGSAAEGIKRDVAAVHETLRASHAETGEQLVELRSVTEQRTQQIIDEQAEGRRTSEARLGELEAERQQLAARLSTINAEMRAAKKELAAAVETSDTRLKLVARGVGALLQRRSE